MSNKFLRLVWGLKTCGNPSQRFLLTALADHADESGRCWPSNKLLQAETGLSERAVSRNLDALAARGLIEIHRKAVGMLHRNNLYMLNRDRLQVEQRTTPVIATGQKHGTPVTVTPLHPSNETFSPVTMTPALEPPLTPNRTPTPLRVVSLKKDEKREAKEVPPFELAAFISRRAWENFEQHRIRKGAPMDDFTRWQVQARLERFHAEGQDIDEIIETAIVSNWRGVFPMKSSTKRPADPGVTRPVLAIDKLRRAG